MRQFFLKMLNSNDPTNSKIFAGLISLLMVVVMIVVSFFKPVQPEVFYGIVGLCAACFGLSVLTKSQG